MAFYTPKHYCLGIIPEGLEIRKVRSVMKLKRHDDRILKALQRGKWVKGQVISKCLSSGNF